MVASSLSKPNGPAPRPSTRQTTRRAVRSLPFGKEEAPPAPTPPPVGDTNEAELPDITDLPPSALPVIKEMRQLFGQQLPDDVRFDDYPAADSALSSMVFKCNYDEGYCGHFSVPSLDAEGSAVYFEKDMAQDNPLQFIQDHLMFHPGGLDKKGPVKELVIHSPGLNTLHVRKPGWEKEQTTVMRTQHYVDAMKHPVCQLHFGTDMDQGRAVFTIPPQFANFFAGYEDLLRRGGVMPNVDMNNGKVWWHERQRDRMEAALVGMGYVRPLWQDHIVRLLEVNETHKMPLAFLPYSRSTGEISAALRRYIAEYVARNSGRDSGAAAARADVAALLRRTVTVVTIGNAVRDFPDGPAYVHYSALSDRRERGRALGTDNLTQRQGVHVNFQEGGGADAVYLHTDGFFAGSNAHNFGAFGAGALRLVMSMSGCGTFREVYEKGGRGELVVPDFEQVGAAVSLMGGEKWLWGPRSDAYRGGVTVPSEEEAWKRIGEWW